MNSSEPTYRALSDEQLARVEALIAARRALTAQSMTGSSAVDALDLVSVARYIESGVDPWQVRVEQQGKRP
jgi:hypothetical protein